MTPAVRAGLLGTFAILALAARASAARAHTVGVEWELHGQWAVWGKDPDARWADPHDLHPSKRLLCAGATDSSGYALVMVTYDGKAKFPDPIDGAERTGRVLELVTAPIEQTDTTRWKEARGYLGEFLGAVASSCSGVSPGTLCTPSLSDMQSKLGSAWAPCKPGPKEMDVDERPGTLGIVFMPDAFGTILDPDGETIQVNVAIPITAILRGSISDLYAGGVGTRARQRFLDVTEKSTLRPIAKAYLAWFSIAQNAYLGRDEKAVKGDDMMHATVKNEWELFAKAPLDELLQAIPIEDRSQVFEFFRAVEESPALLQALRADHESGEEVSEQQKQFATRWARSVERLRRNEEPIPIGDIADPVSPIGIGEAVKLVVENRLKGNPVNQMMAISFDGGPVSFAKTSWSQKLQTYFGK